MRKDLKRQGVRTWADEERQRVDANRWRGYKPSWVWVAKGVSKWISHKNILIFKLLNNLVQLTHAATRNFKQMSGYPIALNWPLRGE